MVRPRVCTASRIGGLLPSLAESPELVPDHSNRKQNHLFMGSEPTLCKLGIPLSGYLPASKLEEKRGSSSPSSRTSSPPSESLLCTDVEGETKHLCDLHGAATRLHLFQIDILDYSSLLAAIRGTAGVFHLASPCIVDRVRDPEGELLDPAVKGTVNVLCAAKECGVRRVVVTPSISAIIPSPGWPANILKDEECDCGDGSFRQAFKALFSGDKEGRKKIIEHIEKISSVRNCSFISAANNIFATKISGTFKRSCPQGSVTFMNIPYNLNLADGASFHEQSISAVISSVVNVLPQIN
ncbi:hypothetical protein Taro_054550 [Colocasia esculenta]|uniref:3-beta hydroxysteroid dehydrogenase/isomerase domain-containing protein n=1 Tax=Colocasia esculenta TaxID=4460 RepID=A0A843XNT8_COLES|nr:hypothetical protein [Colocasia esculenta]